MGTLLAVPSPLTDARYGRSSLPWLDEGIGFEGGGSDKEGLGGEEILEKSGILSPPLSLDRGAQHQNMREERNGETMICFGLVTTG